MLKQYDNVPTVPTPKKRYSVITDGKDLQPLPEIDHHVSTECRGAMITGSKETSHAETV